MDGHNQDIPGAKQNIGQQHPVLRKDVVRTFAFRCSGADFNNVPGVIDLPDTWAIIVWHTCPFSFWANL